MRSKVYYSCFIFFALCALLSTSSHAQITLYPTYATENDDSVRVVIDINKTTRKDLLNYTGDAYAHTGVITPASKDAHDWQHVIGTWGSPAQPKMKRVGDRQYELTIGNPRKFYNADAGEKILKIAIVVRSVNGDMQTEDLFADLYDPGLNIIFLSPKKTPVYLVPNDTVKIMSYTSVKASQSLYLNNKLITQTSLDTLKYSLPIQDTGKSYIKIAAQDSYGNAKADSFYVYVFPAPALKELPAGVKDGINYVDATSATLVLYAPEKKFVHLIGDFNNWAASQAYYMNKTSDGKRFWFTLTNLSPGTEYTFQYLVDNEIRIADPYTDKVLDPWNDKYITSDVYPGLKPYPAGKTDNIVSVLQTAQQGFSWSASNFKRPEKDNLVIYEMLVRDFVSTHSYKTLKDTLSYFKRLGVNAIELMPVSEFEGNESWGYNPNFYFAPDKYYGTKNDFKAFIDECHKNGIAVIMDIVLNHSFGTSPMVRLYWDDQNNIPAANNPWYNQTSPNKQYSWGSDFNHESEATKDFVDRVTSYWIKEYKIDGYRFDFTKGFTNTPGDGGAYDAPRIAILKRMADKIWSVDSTAYVILEHFTDNNEEKELSGYGMMLWGNLNTSYLEASMGYISKSDLSWGSYKQRGWTKPNLVTYMESHDEERLMYKDVNWGASSGSYVITDTSQALNRIKLASALFFTIPGPKMIWQFEELGYDYSIDFNNRVGNKPLRWDYLKQPRRQKLFKVMEALIKLKTNYPAFRSKDFTTYLQDTVKRISISDPSMNVAVIGNFGAAKSSSSIMFPGTGRYYDYFTGNSIDVTTPQMPVELQPGEFHVYTSVKLPVPEPDILNAVNTKDVQIKKYDLLQNYPNPFNPSTYISFEIPAASKVRLKVYDLMGKEVATLVDGYKNQGRYSVEFSGKDLASGIYFYELRTDNYLSTRKMLLLK